MKLKGRALLTGLTAVGFVVIVFSGKLLSELPSFLNVDRPEKSGDWVRESLRQVDRGSRGSEAAHIHFPRKDLDKSNYTSDNFSPEKDKAIDPQSDVNNNDNNIEDAPVAPVAPMAPMGNAWGFFKHVGRSPGKVSNLPGIKRFQPDLKTMDKLSVLEDAITRHLLNDKDREAFIRDSLFAFEKWRIPRSVRLPLYSDYPRRNLTSWERFHVGIRKYALYDPDDGAAKALLDDLVNTEILDVEEKSGGTQLKLIITLNNEGMALFKPQRFGRDYETPPNHFYFVDFERHNAEIAAFHLDRALGFHRVPPTAGRIVNITRDLHRLANRKLAKTFFVSPAKNQCFHGSCSYYCDTTHAVCGSPDLLEGSFASFLPPEKLAPRKTWRNPWKRSYSKHRKATWEVYDDYCDDVRTNPLFRTGRRFLDIMDLTVFDFLIGNMDRHHYETFRDFGNNTFLLHLDHGRSFGKSHHDEISILAPIYQCCLIRRSTFMKFLGFYKGPIHLSDVMRKSLSKDQIAPVLLEPHLEALDRRVSIVLRTIADCLEHGNQMDRVIVDDHF